MIKRLRSRLLAAFVGVALLAMIPLVVVPSYVRYKEDEAQRVESIKNAFFQSEDSRKRFMDLVDEHILKGTADAFEIHVLRENRDLVEALDNASSKDDPDWEVDWEWRTGQVFTIFEDRLNNVFVDEPSGENDSTDKRNVFTPYRRYLNKEHMELELLPLNLYHQYRDNLLHPELDKLLIEENNKLFFWILCPLLEPPIEYPYSWRSIGALMLKILLVDKSDDDSILAQATPYLSEYSLLALQPKLETLQEIFTPEEISRLYQPSEVTGIWKTRLRHPAIRDGALVEAAFYPLYNQNGELSAILAATEPIADIWRLVGPEMLVGFLITLFVTMGVAILVARSISRPIRSLASAAQTMAEGEFGVRVPESGTEEQKVLAAAFNRMAERIEQQMAQLRQKTGELETRNRELDQTHRFLQNVLANVFTGVMSVDRNGRIRHMNPVGETLFKESAWNGKPVNDVIDSPTFVSLIQSALARGSSIYRREIACQLGGVNSSIIPMQVSIMPMKDDSELSGLVVTFHDLSEIRKLEEQVRRHDRLAALGRMSAGVAHEIRNPLGIIRGSAQLLQKRFGALPGEEGLSEFIIEEVNRLSRVVNDFLMFARPPIPERDEVEVDSLIEQIASYGVTHEPDSISSAILTEVAPGLPHIAVDRGLCREAFLNLILNAQEAMPNGGSITIRARRWDVDSVAIEVIDEGEGIEKDLLDRIFDPFYTSKDSGTGLGLSLVHQIVSSHGGRIEVESAPERGSLFRVIFPTYESVKRTLEPIAALEI